MPMHKWMANAAGGTSQRLKRGPAMVRSLAHQPDAVPPDAPTASGTTVMFISPFVPSGQQPIALAMRLTLAQKCEKHDYKYASLLPRNMLVFDPECEGACMSCIETPTLSPSLIKDGGEGVWSTQESRGRRPSRPVLRREADSPLARRSLSYLPYADANS